MHNGDEIEKQERDDTFLQQHNLPCQITVSGHQMSQNGMARYKPTRAEVRDARGEVYFWPAPVHLQEKPVTCASTTSRQVVT